MGLRVTLDSTILTDTPKGWDEAKLTSERDKSVRGLLINYTSELEFWGQGFDIIDTALNENYCNSLPVLIETDDCDAGVWVEEFSGTIILTQLSTYDVDRRIITTSIIDEGFSAKIRNNKSIKAFVDVGLSKNGEDIQAASPVNIRVFNPTAAFSTYLGTTREMWRVFDCFRFIIDYMTDGDIGFKSDLFSGKYYHWMLCNGKELRLGASSGDQLEVSFKDLFMEMHKKTNISFAIEPTPTGYTDQFQLRLEETTYFEQDAALLTLEDVRGILMSFNKEELFSHVEIGSKEFEDDVVLSYPPINFKAFKEESWTFEGECNIDKPLNLVSSWIIDSNIIEDSVANGEDKYDKKIFIIVTDGADAIKYKEYDEPVATGLDDVGTASRLTDTTADFNALGVVVGDMAVNMLTNLTANINSIDAGGTFCVLDTDIFNNGDGYQIRDRPYNYNDPLTNINVIERFTGGLPSSVIKQYAVSGTSNFRAGMSNIDIQTSFPYTLSPIDYNDDTTAPFFDDGNNYDTAAFEYTVPSSGLYGFQANMVTRLNGQLDSTDLISNGDFALGIVDWSYQQGGASISTDYHHSFQGAGWNQLFLKQYVTFLPGFIYEIKFECDIDCGAIIFNVPYSTGDTYSITSGIKTVYVDLTNVSGFDIGQQGINNIEFKFEPVVGQTGFCLNKTKVVIDNVSMFKTPKFTLTQTMIRKSSSGVSLQAFAESTTVSFISGQLQLDLPLTLQRTFSTFSGEKISMQLDVVNQAGTSTQVTILPDLFNQTTQQTDRTEFKTILVEDGGGDVFPVDPDTFPIYKYKFIKAIKFSEFKSLTDAPEAAVLFSKNQSNHIFGWRNKIEYDRKTSRATWELRSKTKINGDC